MLTGQNGILNKTNESKKQTENSKEKEAIELAITSIQINNLGVNEITKQDLDEALKSQLPSKVNFHITDKGNHNFVIEFDNTNNRYYIDNSGKIISNIDTLKISSEKELKAFRDSVNSGNTFEGKYIYLTNDIELDINESWTPIGCLTDYSSTPYADINNRFSGVFDGNNHEISGIYIDTNDKVQGLFGLVDSGSILNLNIGISNIQGGNATAGIVGYLYNESVISNCTNNSNITAGFGGGIVGCSYFNNRIIDSSNFGNITGKNQIGGIVGLCTKNGSIENCNNNGVIQGKMSIGGIAGIIDTEISIINCQNSSNVTGEEKVGGISGEASQGIFDKCRNAGTIKSDGTAGGILGQLQKNGIVKNSANSALISGKGFNGGIVGFNNNSNVETSFNIGNIEGENNNTGGICGKNYNNAVMESCYNVGLVTSSGYYTGGIIGSNQDSTVSNCYNTGKVQCTNKSGGIVGYAVSGNIYNAFFLEGVVNEGNGSIVTGVQYINDTDMKKLYTNLGKNFLEDINNINNGYPILNWQ